MLNIFFENREGSNRAKELSFEKNDKQCEKISPIGALLNGNWCI